MAEKRKRDDTSLRANKVTWIEFFEDYCSDLDPKAHYDIDHTVEWIEEYFKEEEEETEEERPTKKQKTKLTDEEMQGLVKITKKINSANVFLETQEEFVNEHLDPENLEESLCGALGSDADEFRRINFFEIKTIIDGELEKAREQTWNAVNEQSLIILKNVGLLED